MAALFQFPETNVFRAREALDTDFDIGRYPEANLYVELDEYRITSEELDYKENLYFMLNIDPDSRTLETRAADFSKILFVGHRGCGKTIELRRIQQFLNHPERYLSIFIETEKELEVAKMQPEDFYILLVVKMIRELEKAGLSRAASAFDPLLKEWLEDVDVQKEISTTMGAEASAAAKVDTDGNLLAKVLSFIKFEAELKGTLARESKTTTTIRSQIRKDLVSFVVKFNNALSDARERCADSGKGRDIMFIIDGTEKASFEFYDEVFQKNGHVLRDLNINLLTTLRIDVFYRLEDKPNLDFFQRIFVPMTRISPEATPVFAEVVTRRASEATFFEKEALMYLTEHSGGSLRQLIRLANQALFAGRGKKVDMERAQKTVRSEGERLYHALSAEQKAMLKDNRWVDNWAHPDAQTMLYAMVLLKYNGHAEVNPLLKPYFS